MKLQKFFSSLYQNDVGTYLRNGPFEVDIGIVNLHPSKGTHRVAYINENYFNSHRCVCPKELSRFTIKRNGHCLISEYKIQGLTSERDFYCAACCLYMIYFTEVLRTDSKSPVLNLYYQTNS